VSVTEPGGAAVGTLARNSLSVVLWSTISRVSGFVRIGVTAAVLGPTYLGNVFQATNNLPTIAYVALTGSLFANLLIPPLVRHVDNRDPAAVARLAGAFLATALLVFGVVCAAVVAAGPLVLRMLSLGVADPVAAAAQRSVGLVLLAFFMPQMLLYAVVGTAEAVMNAHGRFALASAAPALENAGIIATLVTTALVYGSGTDVGAAGNGPLYLLGTGTTAAVALHAGVQWWGARRVGVTLVPRRPWREPELPAILRRARPSLGYSSLDVVQFTGAMVVANRVPGGVIAFQFAWNFYMLPLALGARPVSVALLPRLSRLFQGGDARRFRDELIQGASLVVFLAAPAAVAYAVLSGPIAGAVTFGQMATPQGQRLLAVSVAALAPGVLGYAALLLGTPACYARQDARTPFTAVLLRAGVAAAGMTVAFVLPAGGAVLLALGLTISVADLAGGSRLALHLRRVLPHEGAGLGWPVARGLAASALMALPAYVVAHELPRLLPGETGVRLAVPAAAVVGMVTFLALQRWWRSPELALLVRAMRGTPPTLDTAATPTGGRAVHRSAP
jgi:putative peptidoglycan lipid II flippase